MSELYSKNVNSLYGAMDSSTRRIGIIQTNLDNIQTVGYKSVYPDSALFSNTMKEVFRNEAQGSFQPTQAQLDLALSRPAAYFLVEAEDGPVKTRDGQFHVNKDGKIVDVQDRELVILDQDPENTVAHHVVKGTRIQVDKNGIIRADGYKVGRVAVDYHSTGPGDRAYVLQGKLEASNVDLQENIVKLLQVKRHIDTVQGMISMELNVDKAMMETYGRNF